MKHITRISIFSLVLLFLASGFTHPKPEEDIRGIVNKMVTAIDSYKTLSFTLKRKERFGSSYKEGKLFAKIQESPRRVYVKNEYPDKGSEVLYLGGTKSLINPGKFPWVNLNLNLKGDIMMKDQHHSINELGFRFTGKIIKDALKKHGDEFETYVKYLGKKTHDGRTCHVVMIDYPKWKWQSYTIKSGENLWTLASKNIVSEHLIMEKNPGISDFSDVKAGQTIQIPNVFSKKSILYIDIQTNMPIVQEVHDEKGMFERYEYYDLKMNPTLSAKDFSEDNDSYGF